MKPLNRSIHNPPIQIVFFDIDETLYHKASAQIPASIAEQVLPRLRAKGIIPAIATGRTLGAFPTALKPLMHENGFELFVTTNGQYNLYRGQVISAYGLCTQRVAQALALLNAQNIAYAVVTADEIAVSENRPEVAAALRPIKADYLVDPDYYLTHNVIQLLAFFDASQEAAVFATGLLGEDLKAVRWHENSVDLLTKAHSKAQGIADVLAHLGLTMENAMAFGDGLNDIEMLQAVGFGIAMGNAEPELKAVADDITAPIDQDGILKALEKWQVI